MLKELNAKLKRNASLFFQIKTLQTLILKNSEDEELYYYYCSEDTLVLIYESLKGTRNNVIISTYHFTSINDI